MTHKHAIFSSLALLTLLTGAIPLANAIEAGTKPDAAVVEAPESTTAAPLPDTAGLVTTATATPDGPVAPSSDVVSGASIVVQLFAAKEWKLAIGALLMVLLSLTKSLWSFVPKAFRAPVVGITAGVSVIGTGLLGGMGATEAVWAGVQTSSFTLALYAFFKPLLAKIPVIGKLFESTPEA